MYKQLIIYVEGLNDYRFFERIIKPLFEIRGLYDHVSILEYLGDNYKNRSNCEHISNFINNIKKIDQKPDYCYHYLFVADLDQHTSISSKKEKILEKVTNLEHERIIVVVLEIESWYLAGLNKENSEKLKLPDFEHTNHITKEKFTALIPKDYDSEIVFRVEVLNNFSVDVAKNKNESFKYFFDNYLSTIL